MKKILFKVIAAALATVSVACFTACGKTPQESTTAGADKITLLLSGWTNTPTSSDDPYRKWIADNYGLDVSLNATTDFANSVMIGFSSKTKPNVVAFPSFTSFRQIRDQNVLLEDWTPYLDKMPNFKKILESDSQKFTKQVMTDANGKLNAIWTPATPPTWSLKIREDWANEYRAITVNYDKNGNVTTNAADVYIPAGATVTDGGEWMPDTPDDLIYFARYIKVFKNKGLASADYYGFTTAGGRNSLGTLETWMPLMWGRVPVVPYGYYVADGKVEFSTSDGSFEPYLNYLRKICDEELIDPSWFSQQFSDDKRTTYGKIGIQWYPGSISSSTQIDANANRKEGEEIDTTDWWETYPLPVAPDAANEYAGYMAGEGLAGNIITVSKQTSLNKALMDKICKLIDDCYAYHDETTGEYHRGVAYDALRWGVGVENGVSYKDIKANKIWKRQGGDVVAGAVYYIVDWGDGTWSYNGPGVQSDTMKSAIVNSHVYKKAGTYYISSAAYCMQTDEYVGWSDGKKITVKGDDITYDGLINNLKPISSASYSSAFDAEKITDGDSSTYFRSAEAEDAYDEQYAGYLFNDIYTLNKIEIQIPSEADIFPSNIAVEYTTDNGKTWQFLPKYYYLYDYAKGIFNPIMRFPNPKGATLVLDLDGIVANGIRLVSKLTSVSLNDLAKEKTLYVSEMRVYGNRRTLLYTSMGSMFDADLNNMWTIYGSAKTEPNLTGNQLSSSTNQSPFRTGHAIIGSTEWLEWCGLKYNWTNYTAAREVCHNYLKSSRTGSDGWSNDDGYVWATANGQYHLDMGAHYTYNSIHISSNEQYHRHLND